MIKCPNCKSDIPADSTQFQNCQNCKYIFSEESSAKLRLYSDIKARLSRLSLLEKNFQQELASLKSDSDSLENFISKDLSVSPPPITPESPGDLPKEKIRPKFDFRSINWELLFGFNAFLILGVISVIFGVGFFIRKAFVSGMLGPVGKVSLIYLGAILSMGLGNFFKGRKQKEFGLVLIGMGISLLYTSTYAAFDRYHLFNEYISFSLMILVTVFTSVIAIVENNRWLAVLGLIGGFFTPVLIDTGSGNILALFIYMTILNAGLLAIAFYKKWNLLNNLGFIFTYSLYLVSFKAKALVTSIFFLNIFFLIYSIVPFAYLIFRRKKGNLNGTFFIFLNSFIATLTNYYILDKNKFPIESLAIVTLIYALNFILMATYLNFKERKDEDVFVFVIAKASLFLIISIPIIFSRELISIFWLAEALILLWLSKRLEDRRLVWGAFMVMTAALLKFFTYDYLEVFQIVKYRYFRPEYTYLISERLFTTIFLLIVFFQFVKMLSKLPESFKIARTAFSVFSIIWVLSLFIILNIEVSAFFYEYFRELHFVSLSVLWAVFAVIMMFQGLRKDNSELRKMAIALFFLTLTKVFFVDISRLNVSYKFISFIVLGLILILTSYLYRTYKNDLINSIAEKKDENQKNEII